MELIVWLGFGRPMKSNYINTEDDAYYDVFVIGGTTFYTI